MKLVQSLMVAAALALPALSFAQSNAPLSRADVRAQLIELQKAGYKVGTDDLHYPQNLEAAEARLNNQSNASASSYGSSSAGTSASGSRAAAADAFGPNSIYAKP